MKIEKGNAVKIRLEQQMLLASFVLINTLKKREETYPFEWEVSSRFLFSRVFKKLL